MLIKKIKEKFRALNFYAEIKKNQDILLKLQESIGRIELRQLNTVEITDIHQNEFRVFSQWGEDGVIQFLIKNINIDKKIFVEFGVENYIESNTRFLLVNNNWSGLVIDGSSDNIKYIKQDAIYWQHNLKALCAFIDKNNINQLLLENGIKGEIGILSIDIDGNDYWIWEAINVISPAIVIIEYNAKFGKDKAITIPYDAQFVRSKAHYSMLYVGASLKALYNLGKSKGYLFVGCNSAGNNAFFVRQDLKNSAIKELTVEEGYIASQFRESRDKHGNLSYLSDEEAQKILFSLPLVNLD